MPSGKNPLMLMMALSVPGAAHAIGLGDIRVDSALNEHFAAEIDIVGATALELTDLRASLANRETFLRYGADRPAFLSSATFKVVQDSHGRPVLAVRSSESFTEPVVNFLVDLNWHNGELVRQYTVLLDPADYAQPLKTPLAAAPPAVATAAPVAPVAMDTPVVVIDTPALVAVPAVAAAPSRKMTHIKVGAKATLRGIAWRVGERTPSDLQKMMIAIFRANPAAFDGNINRLHRGALLTIPAPAELAAISKSEASSEVRTQMAAWRSGARSVASSSVQPAPAAAALPEPAASDSPASEVHERRIKSLEQELSELNKVLHSTDAQLQSLQEEAARGPAPVLAATPSMAAVPLAASAPNARIKSDVTALSLVGGLGILGTALAALYFRMRRRTLPPQPSSMAIDAAHEPNADTVFSTPGVNTAEDLAETHPNIEPLRAQHSTATATVPDSDYLESKRDESTQPLLPIISTGEPAARSSIAASASRVASQDVTINMRGYQGTVGLHTTRLDYNLLDLDMTAQHVQMPSVLNEQVVMKERRTNLADALKLAIDREPDRHDLRLKLLELYYSVAASNRQAFLDVVQKFARERHHLPADQWERVASMGRQIAAENPLFVDDPLVEAVDDDLADCA